MIYTLENDKIRIDVNDVGAELFSIKTKVDDREYLWQGDAQYWSGRAYNLFPICGRLTEGKYTYGGKTYEMNLHGFARKSAYTYLGTEGNTMSFELVSDERTRQIYPFDFRFVIRYVLDDMTVKTEFEVYNTGEKELIYALGGHPGFNVPLSDGETFEDYYLEFSEPRNNVGQLVMSDTCYVLHEKAGYKLDDERVIPLRHSLFDHDAIFLYNTSGEVSLRSHKSDKGVTVKYPNMSYIGFWHLPHTEAPYVCIEPWTSVPAYDGEIDALETKRDMMRLAPGKSYFTDFTITLR